MCPPFFGGLAFSHFGNRRAAEFFDFLKTANVSVRKNRFQLWEIRNWNY